MKLNSSSTSGPHFCALSSSSFSPLQSDHLYLLSLLFPAPSPPCLPSRQVLGYSSTRHPHSVSLLLRVAERLSKKTRNGEKERDKRGREGWGEKKKMEKNRQAVPELCGRKKKKKGRVNKKARGGEC